MPDLIEYCIDNVPRAVRGSLPTVCEARPCLWECGRCYESAMLAVDGTLYTGETHAEILRSVGVTEP
ncbi:MULTISPECIES: hypothetical protein [unclassified Haladaptatus]|uniref:hypothetical protein n=1 Tax=unclassified Haladaptatus TaxID=2622732 RepID=UPI0023E887C8|nr:MULTISPECIES: hypothetical protein [unclassified Haladaptatus]